MTRKFRCFKTKGKNWSSSSPLDTPVIAVHVHKCNVFIWRTYSTRRPSNRNDTRPKNIPRMIMQRMKGKRGFFFTCVPSITEAQTNFRCHIIFLLIVCCAVRLSDLSSLFYFIYLFFLPTPSSMNSLNRSLLFHIVITDSEIHPKTICY